MVQVRTKQILAACFVVIHATIGDAQTRFTMEFSQVASAGKDLLQYQQNRWSKEVTIKCTTSDCSETSVLNFQIVQRTGCAKGPYEVGTLGSYCRPSEGMEGDVFGLLPDSQGKVLPSTCKVISSDTNGQTQFNCNYDSMMVNGVEQNFAGTDFYLKELNRTTAIGVTSYKGSLVSPSPDYISILSSGSKLFSFVQFEAPHPSSVQMLDLSFDGTTFKALKNRVIDTSGDGGIMAPCAGSTSPWCSHLGSEEAWSVGNGGWCGRWYEALNDQTFPGSSMNFTYGLGAFYIYKGGSKQTITLTDFKSKINPYEYGWRFECKHNDGVNPSCKKLYSVGRGDAELIRCAPDKRTCYITEDAQNGYLLMFVAKAPADLSEGRLFVAKLTQKAEINPTTCKDAECAGEFDIDWVPLHEGDVKESEIKPLVKTTLFSTIFDYAPYNMSGEPRCPESFRPINNGHVIDSSGKVTGVGPECLKLRPGMEKVASRLETRRMAAYNGGTTEWHKLEGFDFAPEIGKAFAAVSVVQRAMQDAGVNHEKTLTAVPGASVPTSKSDRGGPNHMRLPYNPCGCVYEFDVAMSSLGWGIVSDFVLKKARGLVCGKPITRDAMLGTNNENSCDVDGISEPDNIAWAENHNMLFIAEDSNSHIQDLIWAFNYQTKTMQRIFASVHGAENTGMSWNKNLVGSGAGYLTIAVQHPYVEDNGAKLFEPGSNGMAGYVGVLGPFKIPKAVRDKNDVVDMQQGWGCYGSYPKNLSANSSAIAAAVKSGAAKLTARHFLMSAAAAGLFMLSALR